LYERKNEENVRTEKKMILEEFILRRFVFGFFFAFVAAACAWMRTAISAFFVCSFLGAVMIIALTDVTLWTFFFGK